MSFNSINELMKSLRESSDPLKNPAFKDDAKDVEKMAQTDTTVVSDVRESAEAPSTQSSDPAVPQEVGVAQGTYKPTDDGKSAFIKEEDEVVSDGEVLGTDGDKSLEVIDTELDTDSEVPADASYVGKFVAIDPVTGQAFFTDTSDAMQIAPSGDDEVECEVIGKVVALDAECPEPEVEESLDCKKESNDNFDSSKVIVRDMELIPGSDDHKEVKRLCDKLGIKLTVRRDKVPDGPNKGYNYVTLKGTRKAISDLANLLWDDPEGFEESCSRKKGKKECDDPFAKKECDDADMLEDVNISADCVKMKVDAKSDVEGIAVDEVPVSPVEIDFDESAFNKLLAKHVRESYKNVKKIGVTSGKIVREGKKIRLALEGKIVMMNGSIKPMKFVSESFIPRKSGIVKLSLSSKIFSESKNAFTLTSIIRESKVLPRHLSAKYDIRKGNKVYECLGDYSLTSKERS